MTAATGAFPILCGGDVMPRRRTYRSRHRARLVPFLLAVALVAATWVLVLGLLSDGVDVLGCTWDRESGAAAECEP